MLVRIALAGVIVAGVLLVPDWLTTTRIVLQNDFFQYWSASRFVLEGGNPYDHEAFFAFQKSVGWENQLPILTWNPPWAIGLFLPFAFLRYAPAMMLWLFAQGSLVVVATIVLWRLQTGGRSGERAIVMMALLFTPALLSLIFGQLSGWLLAGVTLAIIGFARERGWLVGVGIVLLSLKPHFTFLLCTFLFVWSVRRAAWSTLAGIAAAFGLTLGPLLVRNPALLEGYLATVTHSQPRQYVSDTLAAGLRLIVGWEHFWVQFLPLCAGLIWLVIVAIRHRRGQMLPADSIPLLALVSALVAPYGWIFDNVVAIPALVLIWSWLRENGRRREQRRFLAGFAVFCVLLTSMHVWLWDPMGWVHGWLPALLLAVYLSYRRRYLPTHSRSDEIAFPG
jgi:hypothetical protein